MAEKIIDTIVKEFDEKMKQTIKELKKKKKQSEKDAIATATEKFNTIMYHLVKYQQSNYKMFLEYEPYELSLQDLSKLFQIPAVTVSLIQDELDKKNKKRTRRTKKTSTNSTVLKEFSILGKCSNPDCDGNVYLVRSRVHPDKLIPLCQHNNTGFPKQPEIECHKNCSYTRENSIYYCEMIKNHINK